MGTSRTVRIREIDSPSKGIPRRRGLDYFKQHKFDDKNVTERINEIFGNSDYDKYLVVWECVNPSVLSLAKEKYGFNILFMRDIIADLREEVKVSGSRDDVMRFVELIASERRESDKALLSFVEAQGKAIGLDKYSPELWSRLTGLMKLTKRADAYKALGIDKDSTTQQLREKSRKS